MSTRRLARATMTGLLLTLLQACIYLPRTSTVYDHGCQVYAKQMTLDVQEVGYMRGCSNDGCVALLVGAGIVTAASAVVSGSIVLVGNVVYWFERQGRCAFAPAMPGPDATPAP